MGFSKQNYKNLNKVVNKKYMATDDIVYAYN